MRVPTALARVVCVWRGHRLRPRNGEADTWARCTRCLRLGVVMPGRLMIADGSLVDDERH